MKHFYVPQLFNLALRNLNSNSFRLGSISKVYIQYVIVICYLCAYMYFVLLSLILLQYMYTQDTRLQRRFTTFEGECGRAQGGYLSRNGCSGSPLGENFVTLHIRRDDFNAF